MSYEQYLPKEKIEKKLNVFRKIWSVYKQLPKRNLVSIAIDSNNLDEEQALAAVVWHQKAGTVLIDEYSDFPFYSVLTNEETYNLASEISSTLEQIFTFAMNVSSVEPLDEDIAELVQECDILLANYKTFLENHQNDEWDDEESDDDEY